ncbi:g10046 [Coccomyxa viridis]|uniref:G10046 protein n=1 Tax=Coccomyxa viridis TaxID=1274662 RepID=A0ABP1G4H9_9CHLO
MAKRMYISMGIRGIVRRNDQPTEGPYSRVLVLLDKLASIFADPAVTSPSMKAISQALPGLLECLLRGHKWPDGLDLEGPKWLIQARQLIHDITTQHSRDACNQGVSREDLVRNIMTVPGLQDAEANVILEALKAFWDAEEKASDARGSATKIPSEAKPVCPSEPSADSSASAKEQPSRAAAEADGKQKAAEDVELSRQGKGRTADLAADVAADVDEGASSMKPHTQGESMPVPEEPRNVTSEAEKAEKRKAKKARQRAARAELAAQTPPAKDQGAGSTDLDLAESLESTPKQQEHSAGAKAVEQPSVADLISSELETAAPEGLPAPKISAQASEAAGSSRSSSQSPQLSLQLQTGMSQEQQGQDLPSWAAPAAQVVGPAPMSGQQQSGAAPDEVPWQEAFPFSVQQKPVQATTAGTMTNKAHAAHQPAQATAVDSSEEGDQDDDDLCIVCWEKQREVIFYNCMHMCTCQGCAKDIMAAGALCPMCRAKIQSTITARF